MQTNNSFNQVNVLNLLKHINSRMNLPSVVFILQTSMDFKKISI